MEGNLATDTLPFHLEMLPLRINLQTFSHRCEHAAWMGVQAALLIFADDGMQHNV